VVIWRCRRGLSRPAPVYVRESPETIEIQQTKMG